MWWRWVRSVGRYKHPLQLAGEAIISVIALAWLGYLAARPVHIPVLQISDAVQPLRAQVLSGVRGQTFLAPTDRIDRIDITLDTRVQPGSWVRVKFELASGVQQRSTLASAIVVLDRTRTRWPIQLNFSAGVARRNETLYLRLESVLRTPQDGIFYWYSNRDIYPMGDFLGLDRLEIPGQDLLFTLYREPAVPKPIAWLEALVGRVVPAAERVGIVPAWVATVMSGLTLAAAAAVLATTVPLIVRLLPVRRTRLTTPAVALAIAGAVLAVMAWGEIPVGKLVLDLA